MTDSTTEHAGAAIVSLHPASGWFAEVRNEFDEIDTLPLVAWALCDDGRVRAVIADQFANTRVVDGGSPDVFIGHVDFIEPPRETAKPRDYPQPYVTG